MRTQTWKLFLRFSYFIVHIVQCKSIKKAIYAVDCRYNLNFIFHQKVVISCLHRTLA